MKEFIDETSEQLGTEINRANLMAAQGFVGGTVTFNNDGSVTETNANGEKLTTTFNDEDGSITERFEGVKVITKTYTFNKDGSITVEVS